MRNLDRWLGIAILFVGAVVFVVTLRFPQGEPDLPGPAFFPRILAIGLLLCGVMLCAGSPAGDPGWTAGAGQFALLRAAEVVGCVVFYILLAETLGFLLTGIALTLFLFLRLGTGWRMSLAVSLPLVLGTYLLFDRIFLVQLPRGF